MNEICSINEKIICEIIKENFISCPSKVSFCVCVLCLFAAAAR